MASTEAVSSLTGIQLLHNTSGSASINSNSTYENYLELLNRLTRTRLLTVRDTDMSGRGTSRDRIIPCLLALPPEITLRVLFWLGASDLLNLRATSRALHELVHESELALCHSFPRKVAVLYHANLPRIQVGTFSSLIRQDLNYSAIAECAGIAGERISAYILHWKYSRDKDGLLRWRSKQAKRLTTRLTRSFILVQLFLDRFKETLLKNEEHFRCLPDADYTSLRDVYHLDQQNILQSHLPWLMEQDFHDVTCGFEILQTICRARNVPFELKGHAYPFASVRSIFILQGIPAMRELWQKNLYLRGQAAKLNDLNHRLSTWQQHGRKQPSMTPLHSIHHLTGYGETLDLFHEESSHHRSSKAKELFLERQDLWYRAAKAFMERKLGHLMGHQSKTTWIQLAVVDGTDLKARDVGLGPWDYSDT